MDEKKEPGFGWHIEWARLDNRATLIKDENENIVCFIGHHKTEREDAYLMEAAPKMHRALVWVAGYTCATCKRINENGAFSPCRYDPPHCPFGILEVKPFLDELNERLEKAEDEERNKENKDYD